MTAGASIAKDGDVAGIRNESTLQIKQDDEEEASNPYMELKHSQYADLGQAQLATQSAENKSNEDEFEYTGKKDNYH